MNVKCKHGPKRNEQQHSTQALTGGERSEHLTRNKIEKFDLNSIKCCLSCLYRCLEAFLGRRKTSFRIRVNVNTSNTQYKLAVESRTTRNCNSLDWIKCRLATGKQSFSFRGAKTCNDLPKSIRDVTSSIILKII